MNNNIIYDISHVKVPYLSTATHNKPTIFFLYNVAHLDILYYNNYIINIFFAVQFLIHTYFINTQC